MPPLANEKLGRMLLMLLRDIFPANLVLIDGPLFEEYSPSLLAESSGAPNVREGTDGLLCP